MTRPSARPRALGLVGSLLASLSVVVGMAVPAGASTASAARIPLGFYVGAGHPAWVADAAVSTDSRPVLADDYLLGSDGWAGLTQERHMRHILGPWRNSPYRLVLGVPIIPTQNGQPVGTLIVGAQGHYNQYYRALAHLLVANGQGSAILRLGWEFNGNWFTWATLTSIDARYFAAYFRQIVTTMRAVAPDLQFDWNVSVGTGLSSVLTAAYPGNGYVNYLGVDVYDQTCAARATSQDVWRDVLTGPAGLNWAVSFARAHHIGLSIPEWGVTGTELGSSCTGLGDDPNFINQMATWMVTHKAAFSVYFDFDAPDGSHRLQDPDFRLALAAFSRDFGQSPSTPA